MNAAALGRPVPRGGRASVAREHRATVRVAVILPADLYTRAFAEAKARGPGVAQQVRRLVTVALREGLVGAVLDDGSAPREGGDG